MISGILLAAGLSERYGKDKLLERIKGKYLFEYALDQCLDSDLGELIIVGRHQVLAEYAHQRSITYINNPFPERGQSYSIQLGLSARSATSEAVLFLLADQPLISEQLVWQILTAYRKTGNIIVPQYDGQQGAPVLFPKTFFSDLMHLEGDQGGRGLIQKYKDQVSFVNVAESCRGWDVDQPADLYRVQEQIKNMEKKQ